MTDQDPYVAFLWQVPSATSIERNSPCYPLSRTQSVTVGRDTYCQIVLDSSLFGMVSRRHAQIRPILNFKTQVQEPLWEICDLNSANGTYLNGQRLQGCQVLQVGDRIGLGGNGPEFIFECHLVEPSAASHLAVVPQPSHTVPFQSAATAPPLRSPRLVATDSVTLTQLFPILSTGRELAHKAYLVPGIVTVGFVVLMFAAVGQPVAFNLLLATYLVGAAYYLVYQLCGKRKPWWVLLGALGVMVLILRSPILSTFIVLFRQVLPGRLPIPDESTSFLRLITSMFFGAGLMEELLKALPVLLAYWLGRCLRSPWREQIGVWEPLDGILLGTAAAAGFTLVETLGQYVPDIEQQSSSLEGLQLLIPRVLGSVAGHIAYSGYLGYFVGLTVLKPRKRWFILSIGYLTAAILHALWNAAGTINALLLMIVGVVSYAFLAAAILKARQLSPTRSQNFATRLSKSP
ncbi:MULTISPECIES: PrsW family glutamic-type intramembrane protease [Trichocoleus]|uniref:PrsW family glutamic-type intramembrane protease n=1 Tax=Trichocoleus desertorum GB2-A4 TaxID=2933944 RepID=A0ABV0J627_9CYAN|nr:PrsW family glutamic-type intramembrane protease [Trichocoleus sp. FACHB-46]MBD1863352.1 PrsW family intramembrane metalloprotease [Trichocoleus sp. FACHB-46]